MKDLYKENKESLINKYKKIRSWTIASAVVNALLILLIVLACIFGSNNASSVSAENDLQPKQQLILNDNLTDYRCYTSKYTGTHEFTTDDVHRFNDYFDYSNLTQPNSLVGNISYSTFDLNCYYYYNNQFYQTSRFYFEFTILQGDNGNYWRLTYAQCMPSDNSGWHSFLSKTNNNPNQYEYNFYTFKIFLSVDSITNGLFLEFFEEQQISSFIFNKQFNYNAPLGTTIDGVYGSGSFTYVGSDTAYVTYDVGYFISNGQLFNQIKVWYNKTGAVDVYMKNDAGTLGIRRAPSGYYVYMFMEYNNTDTNTGLVVNSHDLVPYTTSGGGSTYYYANSSTWKNDAFRQIIFLQTLTESNMVSINAFNNNNQTSSSAYVGAGDMTNVFTLVASVFTGILPILNMAILPGITLGVLLFVPLVALLVFAIIRIIKK